MFEAIKYKSYNNSLFNTKNIIIEEAKMEWFEFIINLGNTAISDIEGVICMCGINCWATEDKSDLEDFLLKNKELYDYVDKSLLERTQTLIKIYLPNNPQGRDMLLNLQTALKIFENKGLSTSLGSVNEQDWANNWKKYFKPIEIGQRLVICPKWEEYTSAKRKILKIDPGSAFGTGDHATTRLCLQILDQVIKENETVLDVGTGSGILSAASVLLGAKSALGTDIDENSVNVARTTAQLNHLDNCIFIQNDLAAGIKGKFDIIIANIVADIIIRLAPDISPLLAPGGSFIASGIIDERLDEVQGKLKDLGFDIMDVRMSDGWAAIMAQPHS